MRTTTAPARITAALLGLLLAACGYTRHIAPATTRELTRFVLFIEELPDGTVTHTWLRAEEVELSRYRHRARAREVARRIVPAVARPRDCHQEFIDCVDECMARPLARGFGHITSGKGGKAKKEEHCRSRCWQPYLDCSELQEAKPQKFSAIDNAVDWLKRNRKEVLVGSVIIVAGVAFVAVSAGAGILVLAPVVLLAEPETPSVPWMTKVSP